MQQLLSSGISSIESSLWISIAYELAAHFGIDSRDVHGDGRVRGQGVEAPARHCARMLVHVARRPLQRDTQGRQVVRVVVVIVVKWHCAALHLVVVRMQGIEERYVFK